MKNMLPKRVKLLAAALAVSVGGLAGQAQAGIPVVDATTQAQIILSEAQRYAQMALQIQEQVRQYNLMIEQAKTITDIRNLNDFDRLQGTLQRLARVYDGTQQLAGQAEEFDGWFRSRYPDYDEYQSQAGQDFSREVVTENYRRWSEEGFDNIRTGMRASGLNVSAIADEDQVLNNLVQLSTSANTQTQAVQAGNEIAAQLVQQTQKLRLMINDQMQAQGHHMSQQVERQTLEDAREEAFFNSGSVSAGDGRRF